MKKYLLTLQIAILIIVMVGLSGCNEPYQNIEGATNGENIVIENYNPFYCKKVILRDDDIGRKPQNLPGLEWVSNLAVKKDIKITFGIIPKPFGSDFKTINYLNQLNKEYFEFATHGYEHIKFRGLSYEQQYSLIENGTRIMEEYLHCKPYTFIPPFDRSDINTTKVLSVFEYHSITGLKDPQSYVLSFLTDFEYENDWYPAKHCSLAEFKTNFDQFYNSTDEYYMFVFHDSTFLDEEGKLNVTIIDRFENIIDYIKSKNVQFMTIEEAYRRLNDENVINIGIINESSYYVDLRECFYNHTIKIIPPLDWSKDIYLRDDTTGQITILDKEKFEFQGTKGHIYNISP